MLIAFIVYAVLASIGAASRLADRDRPGIARSVAYGLGWGITAPIGIVVGFPIGIAIGLVRKFRRRR